MDFRQWDVQYQKHWYEFNHTILLNFHKKLSQLSPETFFVNSITQFYSLSQKTFTTFTKKTAIASQRRLEELFKTNVTLIFNHTECSFFLHFFFIFSSFFLHFFFIF